MFYLSILDQKKNLMREGGKKTFRKKETLSPFLETIMRATKKNIGQISRKVNEGDKKRPYFKKVIKGDEKYKQKKTYIWKIKISNIISVS